VIERRSEAGLLTGCSLGDAQRLVRTRLTEAGIDAPGADARLLIGHALRIERIRLAAEPERRLSSEEAATVERLVARRLAREPVSRIIGERWFYGRPFRISPATLDPRPESETLIDAARALLGPEAGRQPLQFLDIGTGTGCLLLTLLAEFPTARGLGTDISAAALEVAESNAERLGLAERARFEHARNFGTPSGPYDLIVSNPPYLPTSAIETLEPEVKSFDPATALDGGADGLDVFRELCSAFSSYVSNGWIVLEVGFEQAEEVESLLQTAMEVETRRFSDLAGVQRCVAASPRRLDVRSEAVNNSLGIPGRSV
jgi:release factor glutamine methyltransferase